MPLRDPPVPILATWIGGPFPTLTVTFNHALNEGPLNLANWTADFVPNAYTATIVNAIGNTVVCTMAISGLGDPGNKCSYAAAPPDVLDLLGTPAAPFVDFPIT